MSEQKLYKHGKAYPRHNMSRATRCRTEGSPTSFVRPSGRFDAFLVRPSGRFDAIVDIGNPLKA